MIFMLGRPGRLGKLKSYSNFEYMLKQLMIKGILTSYDEFIPREPAEKTGLLFLHGWASSKEVWAPVMQSLAEKKISSCALDLPGFGKTELPPQAWDVRNYSDFVADFMIKLRIRQAVVVGHSFGGRVGLVLAATRSSLVAKLVLVDSAGVYTSSGVKKILALASKVVKPFFRLRWLQPLRKRIYRSFGAVDYVATPELNQTFIKVISEDLINYLEQVHQPTLLVWGKNDFVTPISYAEHFAMHLKDSRLVILEKAGHYSFLDRPTAFVKSLVDFI